MKIKDDVDLSVLLKYGFEYDYIPTYDDYGTYFKEVSIGRRGQSLDLSINELDRLVKCFEYNPDGDSEDMILDGTLYNLIQDGLVIKIKGDDNN